MKTIGIISLNVRPCLGAGAGFATKALGFQQKHPPFPNGLTFSKKYPPSLNNLTYTGGFERKENI